jgi:hypothetical protein
MLPRSDYGRFLALAAFSLLLMGLEIRLAGAQPLEGGPLTGGTGRRRTLEGGSLTGGTVPGRTLEGGTLTGGTVPGRTLEGGTLSGSPVRRSWDAPIGGAPFYPLPAEYPQTGGEEFSGAAVGELEPTGGEEGEEFYPEATEDEAPTDDLEVTEEPEESPPAGAPVYGVAGWEPPVGGAPVIVVH